MKKSLMGILLIMAIAVTACGAAQSQTAPVKENAPVNDTAAAALASEPAMEEEASTEETVEESAPEEASTEVMEEEAVSEDTMAEKESSANETMMEEEAATGEMVDEADAADEAMMEKADEAADEMMAESVEEEMFGPDWFNAELTDVNTGETFKVADFQGKVILIETMAVWCPICTQQQQQIRLLHDQLGERDDLVGLSLDIDPNESHDILKSHVDRYGFNWSYIVVPPEVSREIGDLYGRNYLNPPAAPMLIIDRQGEAHILPFGVKSAEELQEAITPFLNEG